jgi:hypothetical protein
MTPAGVIPIIQLIDFNKHSNPLDLKNRWPVTGLA